MSALRALAVALLAAHAAGFSARAEESHGIVLSSDKAAGETLHGRLESFSAADGAVVACPQSVAPLRFAAAAVSAVEMGRPAKMVPGTVLAHFNNGDALPGGLVALTAEKLVMQTDAGRLEVPSACVRALDLTSGGVTDLIGRTADWKRDANFRFNGNRGDFRVAGGKMTLTGYQWVSREMDHPSAAYMLSVEYDITDGPRAQDLTFCFAAEKPQVDTGAACYVCSANFNRANGATLVMSRQDRGEYQRIEQFPVPPAKGGRRRISLKVNPADGTIGAWVDGARVGTFKDPRLLAGRHIAIRGNNGRVVVTAVQLEAGFSGNPAAAPAGDTLLLANLDVARGSVRGIADGKVVFDSDAGHLEIPLARLRQIQFSSAHDRIPPEDPAAGRVFFSDFRSFSLRIDGVEGGVVRGMSPVVGKCAFPLEAVSRIQFRASPKEEAKTKDPE